MSVMIWDSTSQAFKDATSIKRYDQQNDAWTDCTSAQVQENGVWVEKLQKPITYLYKDGDECTDITGGWNLKYLPSYASTSYATLTKNTDTLKFWVGNANYYASVVSYKVVDVTNYSKIVIEGSFGFGNDYENYGARYQTILLDSIVSDVRSYVTVYSKKETSAILINSIPEYSWGGEQHTVNDNDIITINGKNIVYDRFEFDISHLTGEKYIYFVGCRGVLNIVYNKIWLE